MNMLNKFDQTIGIYPGALTKEFCEKLIKLFEDPGVQRLASPGSTIGGENVEVKNSLDLDILGRPDFDDFTNELARVSNENIEKYIWQWDNPDDFKFDSNLLFGADGTHYPIWNVQKYAKGKGHYKGWHCESVAGARVKEGRHYRVMTSMFYLNDVEEGGETSFLYSGLKVVPKAGTFLCWPATWPWIHSGAVPTSNDKYIVTTWLQANWAYGIDPM